MVPDACGTGCGVEGGVAGAGGGAEGAAAVVVLAISREVAAADAIAGSSGGDCAVEAVPACGSAATGRLALAAAIRAMGSPMSSPGHSTTSRVPLAPDSKRGFSATTGASRSNTMRVVRSEEHTSELQSTMRNSYAVFWLKTTKNKQNQTRQHNVRH